MRLHGILHAHLHRVGDIALNAVHPAGRVDPHDRALLIELLKARLEKTRDLKHRALRAGIPGARPLDVRTDPRSEADLNREVSERVAEDATLVVWLGSSADDATRAVLSQVLEGRIVAGSDVSVRDDVRVVALAPTRPDESVAAMFPMVMSAEGATVPPASEVK